MKIILDKSLEALGVKHVVIGIAKNVDPNAELTPAFLQKQKEVEEWALQCNIVVLMKYYRLQKSSVSILQVLICVKTLVS